MEATHEVSGPAEHFVTCLAVAGTSVEASDAKHGRVASVQLVRCSHGKNDATDVVACFDAAVSVGDLFEWDHGVDKRTQGVLGYELP